MGGQIYHIYMQKMVSLPQKSTLKDFIQIYFLKIGMEAGAGVLAK